MINHITFGYFDYNHIFFFQKKIIQDLLAKRAHQCCIASHFISQTNKMMPKYIYP